MPTLSGCSSTMTTREAISSDDIAPGGHSPNPLSTMPGEIVVTRIFPTKRFSVLGQFSRYVRPGAVRHAVTGAPGGARMLAFADGDQWTVVAWNEGKDAQSLGIALPNGTRLPTQGTATFTSEHDDLKQGAPPARTSTGSWLVTIPPATIATYTFK